MCKSFLLRNSSEQLHRMPLTTHPSEQAKLQLLWQLSDTSRHVPVHQDQKWNGFVIF